MVDEVGQRIAERRELPVEHGEHARLALFEVIDGARERLDVCTFIIGNDALGRSVI